MTELKLDITNTGKRLTDKDDIQMYITGGKGKFRLKSTRSNKEFTYKISCVTNKWNERYNENIFYVSSVIPGSNRFLGIYNLEDNKYIHSKKSLIKFDSLEVKGFKWLIHQFDIDDIFPEEMEFYHMGICSCCGKSLTTPESIKMGIGPVCFNHYGNNRLKKLIHLKKKIEKKMKCKGL